MCFPDNIKCFTNSHVYSGCGDGVNVWSRGGMLSGRSLVERRAANSASAGTMTLSSLNEHGLCRAQLEIAPEGICSRFTTHKLTFPSILVICSPENIRTWRLIVDIPRAISKQNNEVIHIYPSS